MTYQLILILIQILRLRRNILFKILIDVDTPILF